MGFWVVEEGKGDMVAIMERVMISGSCQTTNFGWTYVQESTAWTWNLWSKQLLLTERRNG
jgi:hypothetical protein